MIVRLEVSLPERVLALHRADRVHGVGAANGPLAGLGQSEEAHFPLAHEVGHRADDILDGHRGVDAMLVEQVDPVGAEAFERRVDHLANVRRPAVEAGNGALVEREPELGGDDDAVARARA